MSRQHPLLFQVGIDHFPCLVVACAAAFEDRSDGVAERIQQAGLFFAGGDDQFVPVERVELYQRAPVNARSVMAQDQARNIDLTPY
jgi:hypothetical protein